MTIREVERLSVTSFKPFEVLVAALKAVSGHRDAQRLHLDSKYLRLQETQGQNSSSEVIAMDEKMKDTTDQPVLGHIKRLVEEEHKLYNQGALAEEDHSRLAKIQVELGQCWDLLRQRCARREFGQDPKGARVRSPEVVEHYEG